MNNLVFLLLAFVAIVPGYTSEKLKFVEGLYVKNHSCGANSGEEQQGKNLSEFSKLKIKAKTASIAEISLETVVLINQSGLGIQPYSCSFNGVAELKGKKLKILKDDEGYEVNGLYFAIDNDRIRVIDNAESEHAGYYCGAHVGFNGLVFMKKDKCTKN